MPILHMCLNLIKIFQLFGILLTLFGLFYPPYFIEVSILFEFAFGTGIPCDRFIGEGGILKLLF